MYWTDLQFVFCVKLVLEVIQCCPFDLIARNQHVYVQKMENLIITNFPKALATHIRHEKAAGG